MSEKKVRMTTPVGTAMWAHIATPKPGFVGPDGKPQGSPKYMVDVVFDPKDPAWNAWAKAINDKMKAMPEQEDKKTGEKKKKQSPLKRELDHDDNPTGNYYCSFKTSDKYRPQVFDKWGKLMPEDTKIGNGSKVRVSYTENIYEGFGGGINMYLSAVQVIDLVEYKAQSASAYGFTSEESLPTDTGTDDSPF